MNPGFGERVGVAPVPDGNRALVPVGQYVLDVGPSPGTLISPAGQPAPGAGDQESALSRAIAQDDKDEKRRRGAIDYVDTTSTVSDEVTTDVEQAETLWSEFVAGRVDVAAINSAVGTLLAALQKLDRDQRFEEQFRLARALSRLLGVAMRWFELLRSLRGLLLAADRHRQPGAKAWALHQQGTLYLAADEPVRANQALSEADAIRRDLADGPGIRATEHNLNVLCRTLRARLRAGTLVEVSGLRRLRRATNAVVVMALLLVLVGGAAAVAASGVLSPSPAAATPVLTQILPASGPYTGGTVVTLTGTGLRRARAVRFGNRSGRDLKLISNTRLQVVSPPGSGAVSVVVATAAGASAPSQAARFVYTTPGAPTVGGLSPSSGPTAGGTVVTITGTGLGRASAVTFGRSDGHDLKVINDMEVQTESPKGSGTVPVTVITPAGRSAPNSVAQFSYLVAAAAHTVTQVLPPGGPTAGGTVVTITGTGLGAATAVGFGNQSGRDLTVVSDAELQVDSPPGSGTVDVTVITPSGDSAPSANARFTYTAPSAPTIEGLSPARGPRAGGTVVTITGTGLGNATAVRFGDPDDGSALKLISDTELQVVTPPGSGIEGVTVVTPAGSSPASAAALFDYVAPALPAVTGVSPGMGSTAGETLVKISGSGLTGATAVKFGGVAGTNLQQISDTELQALSPPGSGTVPVTVTTPAGTSQASAAAQFAYVAPPTITDVEALSGPQNGTLSMLITISGTGLSSATAVTFATADGNAGAGTIVKQFPDGTELWVSSPAALSPPGSAACSNGGVRLTPTVTTPGGTATTTKSFADKC